MAAEVLARELWLDLYKIDLSAVVSKYIGETEKNLARIFRAEQSSNAITFFDEADVLFGKRSEVKDAHDRDANIEVAYLWQKTEEYEGVVILATNLILNIDDAFKRRMNYTVEFPFPDEHHRELLWRGMFPQQTHHTANRRSLAPELPLPCCKPTIPLNELRPLLSGIAARGRNATLGGQMLHCHAEHDQRPAIED